MNYKLGIAKLKTNPKVKVFIVFLFLSALFWFFATLSEKYTYLTDFNLSYKNIPNNLVYQEIPETTIKAQIKASGFKILSHKLKAKSLDIDVSKYIKKNNFDYFYLPNAQLPILQQQFQETELIQFTKDSIFIALGTLISKKVPVESKLKLQFTPGYKLTQQLSIEPDSILVKGPEKFIDSIERIQTQSIDLVDINENFSQKLVLELPPLNSDAISFETKEVVVHGNVTKFTQGQIEVPIQIIDIPENVQIELFPKTALIKYQVAFENYQKITKQSFVVSCQYPTDDAIKNKELRLQLSNKPGFITDYSIAPQQVTYLIKK